MAAKDVGAPHVRRRFFCLALRPGLELDPAVITHKAKSFDWSPQAEPPRMMRKTAASTRDSRRRHGMLGNAVVPDAARKAFVQVSRAATEALHQVQASVLSVLLQHTRRYTALGVVAVQPAAPVVPVRIVPALAIIWEFC